MYLSWTLANHAGNHDSDGIIEQLQKINVRKFRLSIAFLNCTQFNMNNYSLSQLYFFIVIILLVACSCEQKSEYEQLVEREIDRGVRYDSLFLGYELGMEREVFFSHSWELNQQQKITGISQIEYQLDNLSSSAKMTFFPEFRNDKIYRMPLEVQYKGWAPWNKDLFSDSLMVELVDVYENTYGPGFIKTNDLDIGKEAWVKVDGNRRIAIYRKDDIKAIVEFLDLSVSKNDEM